MIVHFPRRSRRLPDPDELLRVHERALDALVSRRRRLRGCGAPEELAKVEEMIAEAQRRYRAALAEYRDEFISRQRARGAEQQPRRAEQPPRPAGKGSAAIPLAGLRGESQELREGARALQRICRVPLPAGDAGLVEAERRLKALARGRKRLYREFAIDCQTEEEIVEPTLGRSEEALGDFIDGTEPRSLDGAAIKLRRLADPNECLTATASAARSSRQILALVEAEIRKGRAARG